MGTTVLEVAVYRKRPAERLTFVFFIPPSLHNFEFSVVSSRSFNKNFHFDSRASFGITE